MPEKEIDIVDLDRRAGLEAAFARPADTEGRSLTPARPMQLEQVPLGAQNVAVKRDEAVVLQRLKAFAAQAGDDFFYQWSTKNKDGTKGVVEGASISCALYVVRAYGNCDVEMRVDDIGTHWIFYARFTDFETGFRMTRAYQQRKDQSTGMKDRDRQLDIVFQIGQSKAIRNVICNALRPFTDFAFEEAKAGLVDKVGKRLEYYRGKVIERLKELDVTVDRVERVLGKTIDKWVARDIARVIAELQSVADGMATVDDIYPAIAGEITVNRPTREEDGGAGKGGAADPPKPDAIAGSTAKPLAAAKTDRTADWLAEQIKAAEKADEATLAELDGQVRRLLAEEERETDLLPLWETAFNARAALINGGPADKKKMEPEGGGTKAVDPANEDYERWKSEQHKALAAAKQMRVVDSLQDNVLPDLREGDKKAWVDACNAKAKELVAPKGGKK